MSLAALFRAYISTREKNWPHRWSTATCYGSRAVNTAFAMARVRAADAAVIDVGEGGLSNDVVKTEPIADDMF